MKFTFLQDVFTDTDGGKSSKRVATFVILSLVIAVVIAVQFFDKPLNDKIWDDLINTFWVCMSLVAGESLLRPKTGIYKNGNTE